MSNAGFMDSVILFGDSITEARQSGALNQRMSEYFNRRLDVVNRGYGGYNTEWAIPVFKKAFATKEQVDEGKAQRVRLVTIWFGANDAVLKGERQHVPLARYQENLTKFIHFLRDQSSPYYSPDTRIILFTPPPLIPTKWTDHVRQRMAEQGIAGEVNPDRTAAQTQQYAEACLQVAEKEKVAVVNTHSAIIKAAGGDNGAHMDPYLSDGLHLTALGYDVVVTSLVKVIEQEFPELANEVLPMRVPSWDTVDPANPNQVLGSL